MPQELCQLLFEECLQEKKTPIHEYPETTG